MGEPKEDFAERTITSFPLKIPVGSLNIDSRADTVYA